MLFETYCDETWDGSQDSICLFASLCSREDDWFGFADKWQAVLKQAGISEFHAADCASGRVGEYRCLPDALRNDLYDALIGVIVDCEHLYKTIVALELSEYKKYRCFFNLIRKLRGGLRVNGTLGDPWFIVCQFAVERVILDMRARSQLAGGDKVSYVFDDHANAARAKVMFDDIKSNGTQSYVPWMGQLDFGDSKAIAQLQAADLLAYEARRYMQDPSDVRWQWSKVSRDVPHIHVIPNDKITILLDNWRAQIGPDECARIDSEWQRCTERLHRASTGRTNTETQGDYSTG